MSQICDSAPADLRVWTAPTRNSDAAARLVESALGEGARKYLRSAARSFPLVHEGYYFSVAHSFDITAVAVARVAVGVDVERRLTGQACADLVWAWSTSEQAEILNQTRQERISTEIWTAKEAAGKALGVGLHASPRTFDSSPGPATAAHRTIAVSSAREQRIHLNSHGIWLGESHLRIAWRH